MPLKPGSAIIITPINPIITASHLKTPTFSLSKKIDNTVINSGAAYDRLTTTAKGSSLNATTIAIKAIKPIRHLNKCSFDLSVSKNK